MPYYRGPVNSRNQEDEPKYNVLHHRMACFQRVYTPSTLNPSTADLGVEVVEVVLGIVPGGDFGTRVEPMLAGKGLHRADVCRDTLLRIMNGPTRGQSAKKSRKELMRRQTWVPRYFQQSHDRSALRSR